MNQLPVNLPAAILILLAAAFPSAAAGLPAGWRYEQRLEAPAPGLISLDLPVETLSAARPDLEDLRLYDEAGIEVLLPSRTPPSRRRCHPSRPVFSARAQSRRHGHHARRPC